MRARAYAKINLCLDVKVRREDGYHDLWMVMQSISLFDEIELELTDDGKIILGSNFQDIPLDRSNLCYRAAEKFMEISGKRSGVRINIRKNIPVAAGLAGGSTDCAAVLKLLNAMTGNTVSDKDLIEAGNSLGADVPFMMTGGTCICEGTGEIITEMDHIGKLFCLLVKPDFGVSTPQVFRSFDERGSEKDIDTEAVKRAILNKDPYMLSEHTGNDLESITEEEYPVISEIKAHLKEKGAIMSMMSGSGPTVFGLFTDEDSARAANEGLKKEYAQTYLTETIDREEVRRWFI